MLKIILILFALAAYGAYALLEQTAAGLSAVASSSSAPVSSQSAPATGWQNIPEGLTQAVATTAFAATGLELAPLVDPESCNPGVLGADRIQELYAVMPDVQRQALASLLSNNPEIPVQPYSGQAGVGLCVITYNKVIVIPNEFIMPILALISAR